MLRTGMFISLLTCYSATCHAQVLSAKEMHNPSVVLESTTSGSRDSSPNTPHAKVISVRASCQMPSKPSSVKVVEIYWTRGVENERVVGDTVNHYVDLNLVVRTAGFTPGECVEAVIRDDRGEIAENIEKIVLRGAVDGEGVAYFKTPLKDYTINLQNDE